MRGHNRICSGEPRINMRRGTRANLHVPEKVVTDADLHSLFRMIDTDRSGCGSGCVTELGTLKYHYLRLLSADN